MRKLPVLILIALVVPLKVIGQPPTRSSTEVNTDQALKAMNEPGSAGRLLEMQGVGAFPCETESADPGVQKACYSARRAYYEYYAAALVSRRAVYGWNDISTRVIFVVVILLVATGVYFSWIQFFGYTRRVAPEVQPTAMSATAGAGVLSQTRDADESGLTSEVEINLKGVRVKSPVLGVILLVVSLAFFYLYLVFVYPVSERF